MKIIYIAMATSLLLRALGDAHLTSQAKAIHATLISSGAPFSHPRICGSLIRLYVKCGLIDHARHLLDALPHRSDIVSWMIVVSGFLRQGRPHDALRCFSYMAEQGLQLNHFAYVGALSSCANMGERALRAGREIHGRIYRACAGSCNVFVLNALVNFYAKCGMLTVARILFDGSKDANVVTLASIISGYCSFGDNKDKEAFRIFGRARRDGVEVNEFVYASVLGACYPDEECSMGRQLHCLVVKSGFMSDAFVQTRLVDAYVRCEELDLASQVLGESIVPVLASWCVVITGYAQIGQLKKACGAFSRMRFLGLSPNEHVFPSIITASSNSFDVRGGWQLHALVLKYGLRLVAHVGNALLDFYAKSGLMKDLLEVFQEMEVRDVVSWNALIAGYVGQMMPGDITELLLRMFSDGICPDQYTYSSILSLCCHIPMLRWGKEIHARVVKPGYMSNVVVTSSLVDMYAKCGRLADAYSVFQRMTSKNIVSWNSMIVGYAQHGFAKEALDIFHEMQECSKPNDITFIGVLSACVHAGLTEEGRIYFDLMVNDYSIPMRIDHAVCMVDLFARGGEIMRAYEFIQAMPFEPDRIIWRSLLFGCKLHGDVEMGKYAASRILQIDPEDVSAHVMLSGVYADANQWNNKAEVRRLVKGLKKDVGCSWIELENKIQYFVAGDGVHGDLEEVLNGMSVHMIGFGYIPEACQEDD